jgi:hypothetical protein
LEDFAEESKRINGTEKLKNKSLVPWNPVLRFQGAFFMRKTEKAARLFVLFRLDFW